MSVVLKMYRNKNKLLVLISILTILAVFYNETKLKQKNEVQINEFEIFTLFNNKFSDEPSYDDPLIAHLYPNQTEAQADICRIPRLLLKGHQSVDAATKCKQRAEWGYLKSNHWNLNFTVVNVLKQLSCQYRTVNREDDFKLVYSKFMKLVDQQFVEEDVIEVLCQGKLLNRLMHFNHLYVQIVPKINPQNTLIPSNKNCKPLNIILLSYDSISRVSWFKRLPKTTNFLINDMKFNILHGQSILGDGTPACMIPLLTGKTEAELPSALKSDPKGKYVDEVYPFIWNELHTRGYMSFHMEDWPQVSTFTYRMRGMSNRTAHHYMRSYQLNLWNRVSPAYWAHKDDMCIGSVKRHKKALDLMTDFVETYKDNAKNHIAIMHYIENSHDGNSRANQLDSDLHAFLADMHAKDNFKNTAVFLYSDHGSRFGEDRNAPQGYLEERQPFFSVYLPPEYRHANPDRVENLERNGQQLTTAFDVHETLRDLTCIDSKRSVRAVSLLDEIPIERSCEEMGISWHYCVCQKMWTELESKSQLAHDASKFLVNYINTKLLSLRKEFCIELTLKSITRIQRAVIRDSNYLKVNFMTLPNEASYEALVKKGPGDNEFFLESASHISRSDAYGKQADCLVKAPADNRIQVDLRKFCICKN